MLLAVIAAGFLVPAPRHVRCGSMEPRERERFDLARLLYEGLPLSLRSRPTELCPSLPALAEEVHLTTRDVWGRERRYSCGELGGRWVIVVGSHGPDGAAGTDDDLVDVLVDGRRVGAHGER